MFAAKGSETPKVTIGDNISTQYQFIDVNDDVDAVNDPEEYNNFLMSHIRLNVNAELGEGWSSFMSIDLAGLETTQLLHDEWCGESLFRAWAG